MSYRATDADGSVSEAGTVTVKIDKTGPQVDVSGVDANAEYGGSADVTLDWAVTDATSGAGTTVATLDVTELAAGTAVALHTLPLGTHTLAVTAQDQAGNATEQTVTFTTDTSIADLRALVERFEAAGQITGKGAHQLHTRLTQAERQAGLGHAEQAQRNLELFAGLTGNGRYVAGQTAGDVLRRDAEAVRAQLG